MANTVKGSIRLRADTIANWLLNRNKILPLNELSIIKFDDGISLKLGNGSTYSATDFIKFYNLCVTNLTNGTYSYSLPSSNGTLALTADVSSVRDSLDETNAALQSEVSDRILADQGKVDKNMEIIGATKCKITYDSKGLVVEGSDLTQSDIPSLPASKITSGTFSSSDMIPSLPASKITSGTFSSDRIPSLDASKITGGTFDAARIPTLDQSKISGLSTALNNKVDKVSGKGLSTNDYTTEEKSKLAGLSNYDDSQVRALIQSLTAALQSEVAERNLMEQRLIAYVDEKTSNAIDNVLNASYGN